MSHAIADPSGDVAHPDVLIIGAGPVGLADQLERLTDPADIYEWRNGREQTLLRFDWAGIGPSGWPMASMFNQPALEAVQLQPADGPADDAVEVVARDSAGQRHRFTARWAIGCDGANSFVRDHMKSGLTGDPS